MSAYVCVCVHVLACMRVCTCVCVSLRASVCLYHVNDCFVAVHNSRF